MVTMLLGNKTKTPVTVLLDSGCTTPIISAKLVAKLGMRCYRHEKPLQIRSFDGTIVQGAGQDFTPPLNLQHRAHYTKEVFQVATLDLSSDILLPFWWISEHPPQGAWDSLEMHLSSPQCLRNCAKSSVENFSIELDDSVLFNQQAGLVGYVSAAEDSDPLEQVPREFRHYLGIMGSDATDALPEDTGYDHEINLKEGEKPPWGPIYPLSEIELATLREWIKDMLRTGKI